MRGTQPSWPLSWTLWSCYKKYVLIALATRGGFENLAFRMYMLLSTCITEDVAASPTEGTLVYLCLKKNLQGKHIKIIKSRRQETGTGALSPKRWDPLALSICFSKCNKVNKKERQGGDSLRRLERNTRGQGLCQVPGLEHSECKSSSHRIWLGVGDFCPTESNSP